MTTIGAAVDKMSGLPGQHLIALFTEGFSMIATGGDIAISEVRPAISSAVRSGVMMYTFDVKDPSTAKQPTMESYSLASEILNSKRDMEHGTSLLAGQTGGGAFYNLDGLSGQLQTMLDANRVWYRLAYYPPAVADPRKFRGISVSVKEHPEYQVRTPKGYDMTAPRR
jgi:VWFA-related protein